MWRCTSTSVWWYYSESFFLILLSIYVKSLIFTSCSQFCYLLSLNWRVHFWRVEVMEGTQRKVDCRNTWITFMYCTGHPLREHWLTGKLTPADSFSMFHAAKLLQDSGLLPPGNQICPDFSYLITTIWTLEVEKD
jgi:hypothetical protein